jgi:hypothetical protein
VTVAGRAVDARAADPDRALQAVGEHAPAHEDGDARRGVVPPAVVRAAPLLVARHDLQRRTRSHALEELLHGQVDLLPACGLLQLEVDLVALPAAVDQAKRQPGGVGRLDPEGQCFHLHGRQPEARVDVVAAAGEVPGELQRRSAIHDDALVDDEIAHSARELGAVAELPPAALRAGRDEVHLETRLVLCRIGLRLERDDSHLRRFNRLVLGRRRRRWRGRRHRLCRRDDLRFRRRCRCGVGLARLRLLGRAGALRDRGYRHDHEYGDRGRERCSARVRAAGA